MAFDFDHEVFTTDDFLGVDAEFTPSGGVMRVVRVAFMKDVEPLVLGGQVVPSDYDGKAGCVLSLVSDAAKGDTLKVGTTTYVIDKIRSDETGWTTIFLVEAIP